MSFLNSYLERFHQSNIIFIHSANDALSSSNYTTSNERMDILGKLWNGIKVFWRNSGHYSSIFLEWQRNDMTYLRGYSLCIFRDSKRAPLDNNERCYSSNSYMPSSMERRAFRTFCRQRKALVQLHAERLYNEIFVTSNHCNKIISCKYS